MIEKLFLPERLFGKQVIPIDTLGITLDKNNVYAITSHTTREKTSITNAIMVPIEQSGHDSYNNRATAALRKLAKKLPPTDHIRICVPSSLVFFKEHSVPLSDREKIRMILPFEIEDKLPISLEEAVIDFTIVSSTAQETTLLVAAIRKSDLEEIINMYLEANIYPTAISIDIFCLHSIYQQIDSCKNVIEGAALVDMGDTSSRLAFLQNGAIRLTRTIPKGLNSLVDIVKQEADVSQEEAYRCITSENIHNPAETLNATEKIAHKACFNYLNDIQFTLNSYSQKLQFYGEINQITFSGNAKKIGGFDLFASTVLQTHSVFFPLQEFFNSTKIENNSQIMTKDLDRFLPAIGLACPSEEYRLFSFQRGNFQQVNTTLLRKQLIAGLIVFSSIMGLILLSGFAQIQKLSREKKNIESRVLQKIKPFILSASNETLSWTSKRQLERLSDRPTLFLSRAQRYLQEAEDVWLIRKKHSIQPLVTQSLLTRTINRASYDIDIQEILIDQNDENQIVSNVSLLFKSKQDDENDWHAFTKFRHELLDSNYFILNDFKEELGEDGGVQVTLPLVRKQYD